MSEEQKIRKVTPEELLNKFYNFHLNEVISAWINIDIFNKKDPNETVGNKVGPQIGKQGQRAMVEIRAKDALEQEYKRFESQAQILKSIALKLKEYEAMKSPEKVWQLKFSSQKKPGKK